MASQTGNSGTEISPFAAAAEMLRNERRPRNSLLRDAEKALVENQLVEAGELLSRFVEKHPDDSIALNLMAATVCRLGRKEQAAALLARSVALDSGFGAARYEYANLLFQLNKTDEALWQVEELLKAKPRNVLFRDLKSVILAAIGDHAKALSCCREMAEEFPHSPEIWIKYGAALRSVGLREQCVAAYRKAIALRPAAGEAYWSLAGLKNYRFSESEVAEMQGQLGRTDLPPEERMYFHFALGSALGAEAQYERSFENYARGNAIKRLSIEYDPGSLTRHVQACKALMTAEFFGTRAGSGCDAAGPIFIIGMQRAGSTLLEQILASHSAVEATAELPEISLLAEHIGENIASQKGLKYPEVLAKLDATLLRNFGERYIETTRPRRHLGRPFFIDKMPYNFLHAGLILLILPNAKIIDVRRHPLSCCFSNFAMHFKSGPLFAYRLAELGHAYRFYVELMAHFDAMLPGRIHRVFYEDLVRDPENEVRGLLDCLGLPFEDDCLEFHKRERAMDSASSEQVRRPIYKDSLEQWRHYERWLGPLRAALGPVLESYPKTPSFAD